MRLAQDGLGVSFTQGHELGGLLSHEWSGLKGRFLALETRAFVIRLGAKEGPCNELGVRGQMSKTHCRLGRSPREKFPNSLLLNGSIYPCAIGCFLTPSTSVSVLVAEF